MAKQLFIMLMAFSFSCNSGTTSRTSPSAKSFDSTPIQERKGEKTETVSHPLTHLHDTISVNGSFILFLLPDSARFGSYTEDSGIYEADADFGEGINNTLNSLSQNNKYKHIAGLTTSRRYVWVRDCMTCPLLIDRDTVSYGFILSAKGKQVKTIYNQVHSGNYLQDVDDYFEIENNSQ